MTSLEIKNKIEEVKAEAKELTSAEEINAKIKDIENLKAQLKLVEMDEAEKAEIKSKINNGEMTELGKEGFENMENKNISEIVAKAVIGKANAEELRQISNLMSEGDATHGGVTVPDDQQTAIKELQRKKFDIRKYIDIEPTDVLKGSRVKEMNEPEASGFASVDEGLDIQKLYEPELGEVDYSIRKYAGYIPVTKELENDSSANILGYINKWMAKNELNTYAYQVLNGTGVKSAEGIMTDALKVDGKLKDRVEKVDTAPTIRKFKTVKNKDFEDIDMDSLVVMTNADGYDYIDGLEDKNGRPYLQEDVTKASGYKFLNMEIVKVPSKFLANIDDEGITRTPFIIGDLKMLYTMYKRKGMEIESTKIGGNAWRQDKTEIKGSFRFDGKINGDVKAVKILLAKLV